MDTTQTGLPVRRGPRPRATTTNPHVQLDQNAPAELQDRLRDHALSLPGVRRGVSSVSVPGTVAFFLDTPTERPAVPDILGGGSGGTSTRTPTAACTCTSRPRWRMI